VASFYKSKTHMKEMPDCMTLVIDEHLVMAADGL
jgi:hypothetical protein